MKHNGYIPRKAFRMADHLDVAQRIYTEYHNLESAIKRRYFVKKKALKFGISTTTIRQVIKARGPYKKLKDGLSTEYKCSRCGKFKKEEDYPYFVGNQVFCQPCFNARFLKGKPHHSIEEG